MTNETTLKPNRTSYVAQIVAAYTSNNEMAADELFSLIKTVHGALIGLGSPAAPTTDALVPAVPIKKSVFPDHIVCLEEGKSFKMIKRHLLTDHGMTQQQYRERWGLPATYPMVSPNHTGVRSALAKKNLLGQRLGMQKVESSEGVEPLVRQIPAGKRGRTEPA
jgi:predicted transcriptional regulator